MNQIFKLTRVNSHDDSHSWVNMALTYNQRHLINPVSDLLSMLLHSLMLCFPCYHLLRVLSLQDLLQSDVSGQILGADRGSADCALLLYYESVFEALLAEGVPALGSDGLEHKVHANRAVEFFFDFWVLGRF